MAPKLGMSLGQTVSSWGLTKLAQTLGVNTGNPKSNQALLLAKFNRKLRDESRNRDGESSSEGNQRGMGEVVP